MKRALFGAILLTALVLAGCGAIPSPEACARAARDHSGIVAGAFDTNVAKVRALGPLHEPPRWAELPLTHPTAYCYIDTEIDESPPLGPDATIGPPRVRSVVVVVDGESLMIMYGPRELVPVRAP